LIFFENVALNSFLPAPPLLLRLEVDNIALLEVRAHKLWLTLDTSADLLLPIESAKKNLEKIIFIFKNR
jgi:hypothetical protein